MRKLLATLFSAGLIIIGAHWAVSHFLLPESWQTERMFLYDPILLGLSFLIIFTTKKVSQLDYSKTGLIYAYMTIAKLLILAVVFLVESKSQLQDNKFVIVAHFILPAFIFIALETILVRKVLQDNE